MKHVFITGALLFSFATISAQAVKPGTSNEKPVIVNKEINKEKLVIKKTERPSSTLVKEKPTKKESTKVNTNTKERPNVNRAAQTNTNVKEARPSNNRAAQSTLVKEKPVRPTEEKPNKLSSDFCNGFRDGYLKQWNFDKDKFENVPVPICKITPNCEGYKCGYKAGMKRAMEDKR